MKSPSHTARVPWLRLVPGLASLSLLASPAPAQEVEIPAGWDLSAALALFRNLPLFDPAAFPETEGKVLCHFSEARNESKEALSFFNTYEFYRKAREGGFLHLTIQETSHTELPKEPTQGAIEIVADARQEAGVIPELPSGVAERAELSRVVAYVLDHRQSLVQSDAGKLAQSLNYTKEGKLRPGNYVQPRVTFFLQSGAISKIRVYGLEALLTGDHRAALLGGQSLENRVLELTVDTAGSAQAALVPLGVTPNASVP